MRMNNEPGEWAVAYHGTNMKVVPNIIRSGFRVGAGQGAKKTLDSRTREQVGEGVYCTPNLPVAECYSNGKEDNASEQQDTVVKVDGKEVFFAFQCRVDPTKIRRPSRPFARCNDEEIMGIDGCFEWIIGSEFIRPYGVLVRDKQALPHTPLAQLIGNGRWNKSHEPKPPGYFASQVPGGPNHDQLHDPEQLLRSYEVAKNYMGSQR